REEHEQWQSRVADEEAMQWREPGTHVFVGRRVLLLEASGDRLQLRVGSLERRARGEPRDCAHEMRAAEENLTAKFGLPAHRLQIARARSGPRSRLYGRCRWATRSRLRSARDRAARARRAARRSCR